MGIDLKTGIKKRKVERKEPKSTNPYIRLLHNAFKVVYENTGEDFTKVLTKRLCLSKTNRPVLSVSRLAHLMHKREDKIAVVASTVTNDERLVTIPKLTICALKFSATARSRIEKAGGRCMSFDELLAEKPTGDNCVLLQGRRSCRAACKKFGSPGSPNSHVKPKGEHKGRRGARGRHSW